MGLGQLEFSQHAGIDPKTLRGLERGVRWPRTASVAKIEAALELQFGTLDQMRRRITRSAGHELDQPADATPPRRLSREDLNRLGDMVRNRRIELNMNQLMVEPLGGPPTAVLQALEDLHASSLSLIDREALDHVMHWTPGSVDAILAGGYPTLSIPTETARALTWQRWGHLEGRHQRHTEIAQGTHQLLTMAGEPMPEGTGRHLNLAVNIALALDEAFHRLPGVLYRPEVLEVLPPEAQGLIDYLDYAAELADTLAVELAGSGSELARLKSRERKRQRPAFMSYPLQSEDADTTGVAEDLDSTSRTAGDRHDPAPRDSSAFRGVELVPFELKVSDEGGRRGLDARSRTIRGRQGPTNRDRSVVEGGHDIDEDDQPVYNEDEVLAAFEPEDGDEDKQDPDWDNIP